jgi:hypothetical protein
LRNIKEVLKTLDKENAIKVMIKMKIKADKSNQENKNNSDTLDVALKDENNKVDSINIKNTYSFKSYEKHCDWSTELKPNSSDIEV